ncbi:uncharacterized protein RAG0_07824 [Rhynchosporium agropyri]|uniref:Transcription factor CBF/NF-Y/archaeal histone domain-containing protein n=1 Tax=Rhynchosporium agropyri TaxID=914238 RepID=A0A1E1KN74_9HELO|nr:uncharacterized protein RAG0_07824 [Rhynchosporium agropyri]
MKNALPKYAHISKEAKECMQKCVCEFISFITSEGLFTRPELLAAERSSQESRNTISCDDILISMTILGFKNYRQGLKNYISAYSKNEPPPYNRF